jgi:hypothetical protein
MLDITEKRRRDETVQSLLANIRVEHLRVAQSLAQDARGTNDEKREYVVRELMQIAHLPEWLSRLIVEIAVALLKKNEFI